MKRLGIVPGDTSLSPRSRYWNYGETVTGVNPAWSSLDADRRSDLARRMAIYAAMVDRIDQNIGRVVADLKARDELDHTLIVFLSDNGACAELDPFGFDLRSSNHNILHTGEELEAMGGPGTYHSAGSGWAGASNTPWRLYKHFSHEGGIASPCIVHWPAGGLRAGQIEHHPAHVIDLMPTLAQAAGAEVDTPPATPGENLLPLLKRGTETPRALFFEHEGNRAVHDGRWKLVALRDQPWELYDMSVDRTELHDLADEKPELVEELAGKWAAWAAANHVTPLPEDYEVDYLRRPGQQPAAAAERPQPDRRGTQ